MRTPPQIPATVVMMYLYMLSTPYLQVNDELSNFPFFLLTRLHPHLNWQSSYDACETPKESESPRFKAIMQATSAPRKRNPSDIKSFSHELNSKGVRPFPFLKPRGVYNLKVISVIVLCGMMINAVSTFHTSILFLPDSSTTQ